MKGWSVCLDHIDGREAAALLRDGQLDDVAIDLADVGATGIGAIYRARFGRPMKGQGGAMVDLGGGRSGFLRGVKGLGDGQTLLVQVSGTAEPGKALPVGARLLFKGRGAIVTPGAPGVNLARGIRDEELRGTLRILAQEALAGHTDVLGLILRSAAPDLGEDDLFDEIRSLRDLALSVLADGTGAPELLVAAPTAHELAWREWSLLTHGPADTGGFAVAGVLDALDAALTGDWALAGGGSICVQATRALVAVDVNTGGDMSLAAGTRANMAAARALPRALRVQGLGGQITLDPAPMPKTERRRFEDALRAAFRQDGTETALAGWTPLGHYELRRKRDRVPLRAVYRP